MKIAIGTTNQVKVNAVKQALTTIYPQAEFIAVEVSSEVSNQPITEQEARLGARNRAMNAREVSNADFGVGLEGGVIETEVGMFCGAWCCIVDNKETESYGGGMYFHLPDIVANKIRSGGELGPIMDHLTGQKDTKLHKGAVDVFTGGLIDRTSGYQQLVELATSKFVASKYF